MKQVRVWDLPTRAFHWLLVTAMIAAYLTGEEGGEALIWHGRIGLFIVGLVSFRLAWGVLGSTHARFSSFVRGPTAIREYLRGKWQGLGHNPLGALSVLALLALLTAQFSTGLFSTEEDTGYTGYLAGLIGSELSQRLAGIHHQLFDLLLIVVGLHVAAIIFYTVIKKESLVKPMITGDKEIAPDCPNESAKGGGAVAFLLALSFALGTVWLASGAWIDKPPPPAAASFGTPTTPLTPPGTKAPGGW